MNLRDVLFLLIGFTISLIIFYILIIKKFNKFINNEIENNDAYRNNAKSDLQKSTIVDPDKQKNVENNDETWTNW